MSPILIAAYALHMAATAVWIGGLITLGFLLPVLDRPAPASDRAAAGVRRSRRFLPIAWLCLAAFVASGLIQMSASPRYTGLLSIESTWSVALLVKHLIVAAMTGLLAYQTWVVHPWLERMALGLAPADAPTRRRLEARDRAVLRASALLGIVVLVLTAVARVSA